MKEASLLKLPRPENINSAISLVNLILWLLKQKKTGYQLNSTFEKKYQFKVTDIMGPLSILWNVIENSNSAKDPEAPVVHMKTVFGLLEKNVVLIGQCNNEVTYKRRKIHSWV